MTERALAEIFAAWAGGLEPAAIPEAARVVARHALLDVAGLCIAARGADYVGAALAAWDAEGACTALGHGRRLDAAGAAFVNGTGAHGEDFDDSFEGTPVHASAVVLPAVLAAAERYGASGTDLLRGYVVGAELICRLALVAPTAIHRAGFHPTAVIGALGAAAGVGAVLRLSPRQLTSAIGIAGSMASGIIEYLAEGTWTKRLHAGWAAQAGQRAALLGRQGFLGPRTVLEGEHGFFHAFGVPEIAPDFRFVTEGLGSDWQMAKIAFKPYACGTMLHPFIDCSIRLAREGVAAADVEEVVCRVGEGTVHRLWEPLAEKRKPSTPYSAKFSGPFAIALGLIDRAAGLEQYGDARVRDPALLALAARVRYEIDPANEYPRNYTGEVRVVLRDGSVREVRQPYLRGGVREPLGRAEIARKFRANAAHGGWPESRIDALEAFCDDAYDRSGVGGLAAFRG
ncbi:MAG TPA: MmgE/PrpD family protein [Geminicoccaceae bacterium]|nr:MmgE/PrpD family protein [Geminicoccaceae bacterium]